MIRFSSARKKKKKTYKENNGLRTDHVELHCFLAEEETFQAQTTLEYQRGNR